MVNLLWFNECSFLIEMNMKNIIPPPSSSERYGALDGLRVYAAIGIVLMHVLSNIGVKPSENYMTETLIPWFTDFTLMFMVVSGFSLCCGYYDKVVERIHIERFIADGDVLYILTCCLVIMGAIVFSWFMKKYTIPRLLGALHVKC